MRSVAIIRPNTPLPAPFANPSAPANSSWSKASRRMPDGTDPALLFHPVHGHGRYPMSLTDRYQQAVTDGALKPDPAQAAAIARLSVLARELDAYKPGGFSLFSRKPEAPRGLYIWGDVGRGKSMLMDL